jgi:hypothetical protein
MPKTGGIVPKNSLACRAAGCISLVNRPARFTPSIGANRALQISR